MSDDKKSRKGKPQPNYGDTFSLVLEMLAKRPMSIPEMMAEKGWTRSVGDYAVSELRKQRKIREKTVDYIDRADGKGKVKVKIFELMPPELQGPPVKEGVPAGNVTFVSTVALLDELLEIQRTIGRLEARRTEIRTTLGQILERAS